MRPLFLKPGWLVVVAALGAGCSGTDSGTTPPTESSGGSGASIGGALAGGSTAIAGGSALGGANVGGVQAAGGTSSTIGTRATGGTSNAQGGAPSTGGRATGGALASGGNATGGALATGGTRASTGGALATGGALTTGGSKTTGGTSATGGSKATGGASPTGGAAATGGTGIGGSTGTGGSTATGTVFSQCRFHFGTIDSIATRSSNSPSMIPQLDFFTPGWMMGTFNQSNVCKESAPGGALAGLLPVDVTYIAANYVKSNHGLCDCNVTTCGSSGGRANDLCNYGAQYITQDWAAILAAYTSNSTGFAGCLGGRPIVFEMEPDWYQYTISNQTQPWTAALAGSNMTALVNALKSSLPQARFSMDVSPWIANNGAAWFPNFNMSLFTFISTSGGNHAGNSSYIGGGTSGMTWAGVISVTGKPMLADTGYGANGNSAGEDPNWNVPANVNARIADGVISISQYNPTTGWGATIASIRGQLNQPRYCP